MKMDDMAALARQAAAAASPEVFHQLGLITRQLHDTLTQLGVMPKLQEAADGLPDARSRLSYIAKKTGEAADKVLDSVDQAKLEHRRIAGATRELADFLIADPVKAVASGAVLNFVGDVEGATSRIDAHLTDIMLAQDFHDLTGQVVAKVVALATDLEASLVKLLIQAAPPGQAHKETQGRPKFPGSPSGGRTPQGGGLGGAQKAEAALLNGPVINPEGRADVVTNQGEVDDLLASLGF